MAYGSPPRAAMLNSRCAPARSRGRPLPVSMRYPSWRCASGSPLCRALQLGWFRLRSLRGYARLCPACLPSCLTTAQRLLYSTIPPCGAPCRQVLLKVQGVRVFPLAARRGIPAVHPFAPQLSARLAAARCREGREAGRAGQGRAFRCREVGEEETTCGRCQGWAQTDRSGGQDSWPGTMLEGVGSLQACRQPTNSHTRCGAAMLVSQPARPAHPCAAPLSSSSGMRAGVAALAWRSPSSGSSGTPRPVRYLRKCWHRNNQQSNSSTHCLGNRRSRQGWWQCMRRCAISCIH